MGERRGFRRGDSGEGVPAMVSPRGLLREGSDEDSAEGAPAAGAPARGFLRGLCEGALAKGLHEGAPRQLL